MIVIIWENVEKRRCERQRVMKGIDQGDFEGSHFVSSNFRRTFIQGFLCPHSLYVYSSLVSVLLDTPSQLILRWFFVDSTKISLNGSIEGQTSLGFVRHGKQRWIHWGNGRGISCHHLPLLSHGWRINWLSVLMISCSQWHVTSKDLHSLLLFNSISSASSAVSVIFTNSLI